MAFTTEGFWEQENNQGITDRIEVQEDGGSGRNIELEANEIGFTFRTTEISENDNGLINPLANKIKVGKLTFHPRIDSTSKETLLTDIIGAADNTFRIVWKRDGSVFWTGNIDSRKLTRPKSPTYFAKIRANDFEYLKGVVYTTDGTPSGSLIDSRQTLIITIADLLDYLNFGLKIRTATSWITSDTTDSTDFLSQIYHETKALRSFARTGDESDRPISVWAALEKVGDPALLFSQKNGEFHVEQISEFDDPENVNETLYLSDGTVDTATTTVDRRLSGFKSTSGGSLVVKVHSTDDKYPAVKKAEVRFEHRTQVTGIALPRRIELVDSGTQTFNQLFIGDGNQYINLLFDVYAETDEDETEMDARVRIKINSSPDDYWLQDDDSWSTSTNNFYEFPMTLGKPLVGGGNVWRGSFSIRTDAIPNAADGTLDLVFAGASGGTDFADTTEYTNLIFNIVNPVAEENTEFIDYELTQSGGYTTNFELKKSWFGDGPTGYSVAALRHGSADSDLTADTWQRRGSVDYRNFHENLLSEIIDLQRNNVIKVNAEFWGAYDPAKILVYDSDNYYPAAYHYTGVKGRWMASLFKVNLQTGSDDFDKVLRFLSDEVTPTAIASTGGGGGGLGIGEGDDRYLNEVANLSDLDDVPTAQTNLKLKDATADLDLSSISIGGTNLFPDDDPQGLGTGDEVDFAKVSIDNTGLVLDANSISSQGNITISPSGGLLTISQDTDIDGALEVDSLDIGSTGHGFDGSGNVSAVAVGLSGILTATVDAVQIASFNSTDTLERVSIRIQSWDGSALATRGFIGAGRGLLSGADPSDFIFRSERDLVFLSSGNNERVRIDEATGDTNIVTGDIQISGTTVIDSARNFFGVDGTFTGDLTMTAGNIETDNFSDWFSANPAGHQITYAGVGDFRTLFIDELIAKAFTVDVAQALAGSDILTKSVGQLAANFDVPRIDDIISASTSGRFFRVDGDHVSEYQAGSYVVVSNSTANDGVYTIDSVGLVSGDTEIRVTEALGDNTADGRIGVSTTITIEDLEGLADFQTYEDGDHIRFRVVDRTSGLTILDVYGRVTNYQDGTGGDDGTQTWAFGVTYAGNSDVAVGQTIYEGAVGLDYGVSGDFYMERTVLDRTSGTDYSKVPYERLVQWTGPFPHNSVATHTVIKQEGNLNGLGDYNSETFGYLLGDAAGDYMTFDTTNGIRFLDGADSDKVLAKFSSQEFIFGDITENTDFIKFDNTGVAVSTLAHLSKLTVDADTIYLDSVTGDGSLALGASASSQDVDTGIGVFADGTGNFRAGDAATSYMKWDQSNTLFDLNSPGFRINSNRDTVPDPNLVDTVSDTPGGAFEDSSITKVPIEVTEEELLRFKFDYSFTASGNVDADVDVEIEAQRIDNNTWEGFSDFFGSAVINNSWIIHSETSGTINVTVVSSNVINLAGSGSSSYQGTVTMYANTLGLMDTYDHFRLKFTDNTAVGVGPSDCDVSSITSKSYKPSVETNAGGFWIRYADTIISKASPFEKTGIINYQDDSLLA